MTSIAASKLQGYITLLRPKQWIKNLFVFAAALFSGNILYPSCIFTAAAAFFYFCLASSAVYVLNDLADIEKDRLHPRKKYRPLAAGTIDKNEALLVLFILTPAALVLAFRLEYSFGIVILLYLLNNILYSFYAKHIVIIDVMSISLGFLFRVVGGAVVIGVYVSPWLLLCTLMLALFLGFCKRRSELSVAGSSDMSHRKILSSYSQSFIDNMLSIITASTVISYSLYTFLESRSRYMMLTVLFVLYGIFRYQYLIYNKNQGESPEELVLADKPLLINIILWTVSLLVILYAA